MAEGALLTKDSNGGNCATDWLEGRAEKSVWTGLKIKGRTILPVASFRCERCGLLENYAERIDNPAPAG